MQRLTILFDLGLEPFTANAQVGPSVGRLLLLPGQDDSQSVLDVAVVFAKWTESLSHHELRKITLPGRAPGCLDGSAIHIIAVGTHGDPLDLGEDEIGRGYPNGRRPFLPHLSGAREEERLSKLSKREAGLRPPSDAILNVDSLSNLTFLARSTGSG